MFAVLFICQYIWSKFKMVVLSCDHFFPNVVCCLFSCSKYYFSIVLLTCLILSFFHVKKEISMNSGRED